MEKLELKHLAPYFPYNLKLMYNGRIISIDAIGENYILIYESFQENTRFQYIKPILRPIEDLYRPETDCGIKIIHYFNFKTNVKLDCRNFPYHVMEQLLKNHFDVFGLIDKDLAISKPFSEL